MSYSTKLCLGFRNIGQKASKVMNIFSKLSFTSATQWDLNMFSMANAVDYFSASVIKKTAIFIAITHANLYLSLEGIKVSTSVLIVFI